MTAQAETPSRAEIGTHDMTSLKAALLVAAAGAAFATLPSDAADYPARPIRIIVGFAAGGAPDTLARVVDFK
jgi:tripartite-type tricarboxylate transporter receptor subunit TctC